MTRTRTLQQQIATAQAVVRAELENAATCAMCGPINGATFRVMRDALGLRAEDLGRLLGVRPESVSRWETGRSPVDRNAWMVLGTLVLEAAEKPSVLMQRLTAL